MRKIRKLDSPAILTDNHEKWTAELLASTPGTEEFKSIQKRYKHSEIKEKLSDETNKKCAYCESYIENVSYPHIEHIYPKDSNPHLTFDWTNLTIGCHRCNIEKSKTEPTENNYVHPYEDEPEFHFAFIGSFMTPVSGDLRAINMINWLDLNRPGLLVSRIDVVRKVMDIYLQAITLQDDARREFIELAIGALTGSDKPYSRVAQCTARAYEQEYAHML